MIEDPTIDPDGPCWCCGSHEPCKCTHRSQYATGLVCTLHSTHMADMEARGEHCDWRVCGSDCVTVTSCDCGKHVGHVMPMGADRMGPDRLPICGRCQHAMTSHEIQRLEAQCSVYGCPCDAYVRPSKAEPRPNA
jgi:hypothetical protein